ncbi:MAG TPA: DUF3302 domain-containing protein [Gammaproteobacteria bacterium]|nr:DUF3302 domain-containing protein [Gammaproteobacteria bacterium]
MSFIDIFSWFVLIVMVASFIGIFVFLGLWPAIVAKQRNHPQLEAIKVGSWVTLILGFALWPLVLVWAYTRPVTLSDESATLKQKIGELESRLARLENRGGKEA